MRILFKRIIAVKIILLITVFSFYFNSNSVANAAINKQINYQGRLLDSVGDPVTDSDFNIQFKLFTASTGGTLVWTETHCYSPDSGATCNGSGTDSRIETRDGLFSVMLGSVNSLDNVDFNQTLYLGINIGGSATTPSYDGEMSPRKILGAVPAAFESDKLDGISSEQFLRNDIVNATTSSDTFFSLMQSGSGKVMELLGAGSASLFTVDSSGNVGIGTTSPGTKLDIAGGFKSNMTGSDRFKLQYNGTDYFTVNYETPHAYVFKSPSNGYGSVVRIETAGTGQRPLEIVDYLGNVGSYFDIYGSLVTTNLTLPGQLSIGTTPSYTETPLVVTSNIRPYLPIATFYQGSGASGNATEWKTNGGTLLSAITETGGGYFAGNVGIGTTTPSSKLSVSGDINLTGALKSNGSAGVNGYVLQTTGSGIQWVATSTLGISGGGGGGSVGIGSSITSGTSGSILFVDSSGKLAQDPSKFRYDISNSQLWLDDSFGNAFVGSNSYNTLYDSSIFGTDNSSNGNSKYRVTIVGNSNDVNSGDNSTIVGSHNSTSGEYAYQSVFGTLNGVSADNTNAIGYGNTAGNYFATAVGSNNVVYGNVGSAFGYSNYVLGSYGSAFGNSNQVTGDRGSAFGYTNSASGSYSSAFGFRTQSSATGASTFGGGGGGSGTSMRNSTANSTLIGPTSTSSIHILNTGEVKLPYLTATSTTATSTLPNLNTTNVYVSGKIGVGTITPQRALHVAISTDGAPVRFQDSNGYCEINPTSTTWTCTSDERLKENILNVASTTPDLYERMLKLRPVTFEWKTDQTNSTRVGFIAQEVEVLFPDFVTTDTETGLKSVSYGSFIPYIVAVFQDLVKKVDELALKIDELTTNGFNTVAGVITKLTIGSREKPTGITLFDESTGDPYCLSVKNGDVVTKFGECTIENQDPDDSNDEPVELNNIIDSGNDNNDDEITNEESDVDDDSEQVLDIEEGDEQDIIFEDAPESSPEIETETPIEEDPIIENEITDDQGQTIVETNQSSGSLSLPIN